jgi:molecular chaperone GrpE
MTTDEQHNETAPAPDETEQLNHALSVVKAQAAENWDKFLRAAADLENYRKRAIRDREESVRAARESVINALLPALDNLERALDHSEIDTPLHEGLLQVQKQFQRALSDYGLTEIIAKPGDSFDPAIHEAVSQVESADQPEGAVVEQLHSAYKIGDRLLRPARVVVSKGSSAEAGPPA